MSSTEDLGTLTQTYRQVFLQNLIDALDEHHRSAAQRSLRRCNDEIVITYQTRLSQTEFTALVDRLLVTMVHRLITKYYTQIPDLCRDIVVDLYVFVKDTTKEEITNHVVQLIREITMLSATAKT